MSVISISSRVDQIQSLLSDTENDFPYLPAEQQNLIAVELEHCASQLMDWLEKNRRQTEHQGDVRPDIPKERWRPARIGESEPWLGLAIKHSGSGAWKWDLVHHSMQWSPELYELLVIDPATEVSDPRIFFDMLHPDDREMINDKVDEVIQQGGSFYTQFRILNKAGNTIWLSAAGTVEHDPSGKAIQASGICQDITSHKLTEEALRESIAAERARAAELKALMDAVPAIIWISRDSKCREMVGNRYGYEFLKMWEGANVSKTAPDEALIQQPYRNIKNGQEIPNDELPMQIAASTGLGTSNYEFDIVFINGETKNLLGNVLPLTDPNGQPAGAVGAFVDITERKRMETELRQSEHRFRVALASAPMTVFAANKDLRYTWIYNTLHHFTEEQMLGKRADEILPAENVAELIALQRSVIDTGRATQQEFKIKLNDSWLSYIGAIEPVFDRHGQVTGLIGAVFDITTQRQLEAIQRENEIKMATQQRLLKTREDERLKIARDIHDGSLQTLMAMTFDIYKLKEVMKDKSLNAELNPIRGSLQNAIQELREVVNELRPPTLVDFGLVKAISEHVEDFREKFPEVDLRMDLDPGINKLSEETSLALYRICQESLRNVIRHANATNVAIQLMQEKDQVILTIQDNGIGFSASREFAGLIADKHYGLRGMKERAEAVGGTLHVASKTGKGTEIRVCVPYRGR